MSPFRVTPQQALDAMRQGKVDLIDVRTPVEFDGVHAESARSVPLDQLDPEALRTGGRTVYLLCKSGARAEAAWWKCFDAKFLEAACVDGGTDAWAAAGLPVVRGQHKAVSLERQVRIAAGALVLIGTLLAILVHVLFLTLPLFVGGGLLFSGITDTCGMAMMLARMPWNRRKACITA